MPLIFAGLWLGLHLGTFLSITTFRKLTFALIALTALAGIIAPLL
jgi:hypothetical protein